MRILSIFIITLLLVACNKPDPNPELKDEIYADLNTQLADVGHELEAEEKQLVEHQKALSEVTPQTGQIKYAQKRVYDSEEKINKLRQEKQWLALRAEERLKYTKKEYLKAFKAGKPWPDPAEFEQYKLEMKMRKAKKEWDVKQRMQEAGLSVPGAKKPAGGEKKEGAPAE